MKILAIIEIRFNEMDHNEVQRVHEVDSLIKIQMLIIQ